MDLSIIIVNYRGWKHLRDCLNSIKAFDGKMFDYEVIIVDNNSADGKIDEFIAEFNSFIFIRNKVNGGFANGCNLGSTFSTGEYLLFLNPDTIASERAVGKLIENAKAEKRCFISSCNQVNERNEASTAMGLFPEFGTVTGFGRMMFRLLNSKKLAKKIQSVNNRIYPDWVSGSVMMIGRKVFNDIGGFDEDFWMYYEDTDLCRRARDKGGEIVYYTDITIRHIHGGSSRIDRKTASMTKTEVIISRHLYIAKHMHGLKRSSLLLFLILNNLITGTLMALSGIILFFIPGMFLRVIIYGRLISYYASVLKTKSWISSRSVNFLKN